MKRIKVLKSNLAIREASTIFPKGWKALKLNETEAMSFNLDHENASFDDLIKTYGANKVLHENEMYEGYIVIYSPLMNQVFHLRGMIKKVTNPSGLSLAPYNIRQAFENGTLYDVYYQHDEAIIPGSLRYVWTFGTTFFEKVTTKESADRLREKLINGAIFDKVFEITDEENKILLQYLGKTYYDKFFAVYE